MVLVLALGWALAGCEGTRKIYTRTSADEQPFFDGPDHSGNVQWVEAKGSGQERTGLILDRFVVRETVYGSGGAVGFDDGSTVPCRIIVIRRNDQGKLTRIECSNGEDESL